ncbi:M61 family metallopeptidase [Thalassobellus citreus]|uniref:M61 family metallopeptidase n=1 Tax=Thalassobellus citreus TaxID=3367752 RepID=UPI0037A3190C
MKDVVFKMLKSQLTSLKNFKTTSRYDIQIYFADGKEIKPNDYGALEHHSSTVMVLPESMKKDELFYHFKNLVAHEFFHIVTPLNIHSEHIHNFNYNSPNFSKHLWLYEGVTEYFSKLFQIDQNLITEKEFYNEVFNKLKTSKNYNDSLSFTLMSEHILQKEYHKNYANVYQKGALIAMCLDILLREESNGNKGLLSLMKVLSLKYGKNTPFIDNNLIDEISLITYPSIDNFFKKHVIGETPINYQDFFRKLGLNLTDTSLTAVKNPSPKQEKLKSSWLNLNTFAFDNVNVIPMDRDTILKDHRVIVSNGKIISVEPNTNKSIYNIQKTIDGTGKYLIPGLSEMHYHWRNGKETPEDDFKLLIANGVTTVRNMAEEPNQKQKQTEIRHKVKTGNI